MDSLLFFMQLLLGMLGVLGVATSYSSTLLWPEQLLNVALGLVITFLVSRFNPKAIVKLNPIIFGVTLVALVAVLFVGLSPDGSESRRWLPLMGRTWQPSEFAKIAVITYLASFFHNHVGRWELWRPTLVIGVVAALIMLEPNISTTLFIFTLAFTIMLAAGTSIARLASITFSAALVATLFTAMYLSLSGMSYPRERLEAFLNPQDHTETVGYQASRAQQILLNAGFMGIGPGRPVRVPEAHTDMVSISVAQALGLTGIASLIVAYLIIAWRGIRIASLHHGPGSLLAAGAATYICGQAALNLLVSSGMLPVTGVVLPFVSHGFNNLVSVSIAMGFMHSAYRSFRKEGVAV
jgi:cell division protein FtsW